MTLETNVEIAGISLFCRTDGPGSGAPWIIFSNSLVTDLTIWDAQVDALGGRYNLLRYDQRGHGRSGSSKDTLTFDRLGDDVLALLDHFNIQTCSFVGLSMGVPTGLRAYQQDPARFDRLVFVDGMARTAPTGSAAWQERIDFVAQNGMDRFAEATVGRWLQPDSLQSSKGKTLIAMVAATPENGFVQCATALQGYDYADVVPRINIPLLAIAGAEDGAMPVAMEKTFGVVPGAQIATIAKAGHVPNFERPDAFNAKLIKFLDQIG